MQATSNSFLSESCNLCLVNLFFVWLVTAWSCRTFPFSCPAVGSFDFLWFLTILRGVFVYFWVVCKPGWILFNSGGGSRNILDIRQDTLFLHFHAAIQLAARASPAQPLSPPVRSSSPAHVRQPLRRFAVSSPGAQSGLPALSSGLAILIFRSLLFNYISIFYESAIGWC